MSDPVSLQEKMPHNGSPGGAAAILQVEDLVVQLHTEQGVGRPVERVSFSVGDGESLGIVGESGSGKSLTAKAIIGLLPQEGKVVSGSIRLRGEELVGRPEPYMRGVRGGGVGMIFQDPLTYLNPLMRVGSQVGEVVRRHRPDWDWRQRVKAMFERVRLPEPEEIGERYPHELSGGMRQRVLLAMALAAEPALLIGDEPTTALDVTIQAQILELLRKLQTELALSLVLISHDLAVISEVSDRVVVMYSGRVMEAGHTGDLFRAPLHPYTEGLVGSTLDVHEKRAITRVIPGEAPDLFHPPGGCRFHPRCPYAFERCRLEEPSLDPQDADLSGLEAVSGGTSRVDAAGGQRLVRCWRYHPANRGNLSEGVRAAGVQPVEGIRLGLSAEAFAVPIEVRENAAVPEQIREGVPIVAASGLSKAFRVKGWHQRGRTVLAVDGVSLDLEEGEIHALVGESGCGKSTLGRLILGLLPADAGELRFRGQTLRSSVSGFQLGSDLRRQMQMVFQDPLSSLNPRRSVGRSVAQPLRIHETVARGQVRKRVIDLFGEVGLVPAWSFFDRFPHELSGGQLQRVVIARALACEPVLVVADEPLASLDVSIQAQVLRLMLDLKERRNLTILFITHDLAVVRSIADRVTVMYMGQAVESGAAGDVIGLSSHPYTQSLIAATPTHDADRRRNRVLLRGSPPSAAKPPAGCRFHTRCPIANSDAGCHTARPELRRVGSPPGKWVACHLVEN